MSDERPTSTEPSVKAVGVQAGKDADGSPTALERGLIVFLMKTMDLSGPMALALLLSLFVQVGFVAYLVLEVPPPPRATADSIMDDTVIMTLITEAPEEPPPPPEDAVEEEDALFAEPEPEPEPEPEEDELAAPEEEPPPEDLEPEVAALDELEPLPPEALAVEGIGSSEGGVALPSGGRSLEEAAEAQRRSGRHRSREAEETGQNEEPAEERSERRRPHGPVRLEDAGTPPELRLADPEIGYPREFRERALAGRVVVQCVITERGRVRACRHRSGPDELADYVISVVRAWDYVPARDHEGQAIAVFYTFRVPFRLL